jgi:NAD-dependent DNA ligase
MDIPQYTGKTVKIRKVKPQERYNEKLIDIMDELAIYMTKKGEPFRARAYKKAQESLILFPQNITSTNYKTLGLEKLPGIGETIMKKIGEYIETGTLRILERERADPQHIFSEIYGVGPKKATQLVEKGFNSIAQLREKQDEVLNDVQKIGLRYYDDILQRIPREEINAFSSILQSTFDKVKEDGSFYEIVGSYRRGAKTSGDIDVILTSPNKGFFKKFMDELLEKKIIVEVLSRGPTKSLVIAKLPGEKYARRVDFLYSDPQEYPFAVLYFTGSKIFNTVMRGRALSLGYSLNEHGMYVMDGKKKGNKVDHEFPNEKSIFDFLKMEYKRPEDRIDGRSVVPIRGSPPLETLDLPKNEAATQAPKNVTIKKRLNKEEKEREKAKLKAEKEAAKLAAKKAKEEEKERKKMETRKKREEKKEQEKKLKESRKTKKQREPAMPKESAIKSCPRIPKTKTNGQPVLAALENFKNGGISVLEQLHESTLTSMLEKANEVYRNLGPNEVPLLSDNQYDILEDYLKTKFPKNKAVGKIGAPVERNKVKLPFEMASMDKIKPDTKALSSWKAKYKGPYVLSCKLDGVSGMYYTLNGEKKLYTRGDGKVGQDISHFIPYLNLPHLENVAVRGEFIMKKSTFVSKYQDQFANARNLIAGTINRLSINDIIRDIDFVGYEVIVPESKPSAQMDYLKQHSFITVRNETRENINNDELSELLVRWRDDYDYEIDGVIVTNDKIVARKSGNPDHSFAFKMVLSDQMAETKVVDVHWKASKDGYLKPRVQIEPVHLGGVKIEYATGFNGAFIENNRIGVGALITIIRSGDVIPYIKAVVTPAQTGKMPDVPYIWNESHVDIMLENKEDDKTVLEKNITGFFKGIEVDGLSEGNVKRIMEAGFDSVPKILKMSKANFMTIEGFQEKMAQKIHSGIQKKIEEASLASIMASSNMFGRGFSMKKIELILEEYPDVLTSQDSLEDRKEKLASIKGMAKKTANSFVDHIPDFLGFLEETGLQSKLQKSKGSSSKPKIQEGHALFQKVLVMTGTRDKELEKMLSEVGATMGSSVSAKTFALILADKNSTSSKAAQARKLDIPLYTPEEFRKKYFS